MTKPKRVEQVQQEKRTLNKKRPQKSDGPAERAPLNEAHKKDVMRQVEENRGEGRQA